MPRGQHGQRPGQGLGQSKALASPWDPTSRGRVQGGSESDPPPSPAGPFPPRPHAIPTHRFWSTFSRSFLRLRWAPALRFCNPFSKYRCSEKFSYRRRVGMRAGSSRGPGVREVKGSWGLASGLARQSQMWPTGSGCRWIRGQPQLCAFTGRDPRPSRPWFPHL